ncbi:MAG TPA: Nramp family divalent metal transporter [Planctomycetota bacterium]|nr:Nramp family divalent metal transporter [Planctomycetota bacterium]
MSGPDLQGVRAGLRMAAPPDPTRLAAERAELQALAAAPRLRRWLGYARFIGPGYLQSAMTLGSGTAASCLFAGAVFGYELLWVAPLGMVLGVLVMAVVAHQTLSTGQRPLPAMATYAGRWLAWGWAAAAVLASFVWHFPQYNLAAAALVDAGSVLGRGGVHPGVASAFVLLWAIALSLLYGANSRLVRLYERLLKYTVWGIVVCLAWVVVHTETDWGAVAAGFVPQLPPSRGGISSLELTISGIAAAVGINMVLLYPYSLLARGWGREHRGLARFDLFVGMLAPYLLATALLVIAAANTLHQQGVEVVPKSDVATLARVLGDVIGPVSGRLLFDVGMVAMALSTITLHMVVCGFVAMEWFGLPFGSVRQRLCMLIPVPGALAPFLWADYAVWLAVPTTIVCGAMLPIAYVGFLLLQRSSAYLGEDRPRGWRAVSTSGVLVLAILVIVVSLAFYLLQKL